MKVKTMNPPRAVSRWRTLPAGFFALAAIGMLFLAPTGAESGPSGGGPAKPSTAVKFEDIPNSSIKRVILTAKAAERLGIETGKVTEELIILKQMVGGRVIPPVENQPLVSLGRGGFGGFGKVAARTQPSVDASAEMASSGESWVEVTLTKGEWERLSKEKPALILPLATRDTTGKKVLANPSDIPPFEDVKRTMLKLYYKVPGKDHGLTMYHRVRVELQVEGSDEKQMVVPYSAVYYDGNGNGWVYVNPEPLVYERTPIKIQRIVGGLAVLTEGPPIGTQVVTVGSPLLYGAEVIFKR